MNASPTVNLRIDFVSDVVCPWCFVGLASLENALRKLEGEVAADLHFQPFQLNPTLGPEGADIAEYMQQKYGMDAAQLEQNQQAIRQRGQELGIEFNMAARRRTWNTFDAHRLLHWAGDAGHQHPLKRALLVAYFTDGKNISDAAMLVAIAGSVGLDARRAADIIASGEFGDEVRQAIAFFQQRGIRGVPAIIIEGQHLISGGQPPEVFEQALRQIAADKVS